MAPLILFGFLASMVLCIIVSVVIAVKNPVQEDDSYFSSKRQVDEEINTIIQEQNAFGKDSRLFLQISGKAILLKPPYLRRQEDALNLSQNSPLSLILKGKLPQGLRIQGYLEKLYSKEPRLNLGQLSLSTPFNLPILREGRYCLILEVCFESKQKDKREEKRIFFEQELFFR